MGPFNWNVELNADPLRRSELNDMPVKRVNGTVIYLHDVGYAHDGGPPPSNVVRVDGKDAVLMSVLKSGAASTLNIIAQIKKLLPRVEAGLPSSLHLDIVNDQSVFVRAAVSGVVREMVIAAVLVGLLILLFLGSWRSTIIILIEIPLAILFALVALSLCGQSMNVMTLGGLALAVGILVDDGTVTIENINYHLELGKAIVPAILDGAQQIVVPAFVTLLCLSIVFVPMFQLGGVAGYLFRPMAMAVVFALLGSFLLSRTLVPTMASYLIRAHAGDAGHGACRRAIVELGRHLAQALSDRLRGALPAFPRALPIAPRRPRSQNPLGLIVGFLACVVLSFGLAPFLGRNFFPARRFRRDPAAHSRPWRPARRADREAVRRTSRNAVRRVIPPRQLDQRHGEHRPACQRHQHGIPEHRHGRAGGRRHADHAQRRSLADRRLRQDTANGTAARVSRHDVLVPAGRHRLADPQLRPAGADRPEGHRQEAIWPTSRMRRTCCGASVASRASPMPVSSRCSIIRSSTSTCSGRSPRKWGSPSATWPTARS